MKPFIKASHSGEPTTLEQENLLVARQAAWEGMVLLKNDGTLPLHSQKIALYGPGASQTIKGGVGSGEVNERHAVSIWEGLLNRGFEVSTEAWLNDYELLYHRTVTAFAESRRKKVSLLNFKSFLNVLFDTCPIPLGRAITEEDLRKSDTDTCIYVLSRQAGEGGDRKVQKGDYLISDNEEAAIRFCARHYKHFVLVINSGSPIDMGFADRIDGIGAILYICQLGTEGGNAVADVLSGTVTPSGKLVDTWANSYSDIPFSSEYSYLNGDLENEFYKEGIFVGYRYFDTFGVSPRYPFGFGLSYTDFSIDCSGVSVTGSQIHTLATVTNIGTSCAGREVAQLYLTAPEGTLPREYQSLAAFEKTVSLLPGESQTMDLNFDLKDFGLYRESDGCFCLEAGEYLLRLGNSSRNTVAIASISLEQEVILSRHAHICPVTAPFEEIQPPARSRQQLPGDLPKLCVNPKAFHTVEYSYDSPVEVSNPRVTAFLDTLSDRDMVDIVVGDGLLFGNHRFCLPGSVGNTTSKFWNRGLANATLCDGPAGLRIQRRSTQTRSGKIKMLDFPIAGFHYLPDAARKYLTGNPEKESILYQYATAFPVATALAQSWNPALMEQVGNAIFREMREYGCTYWLAPAVNIHRNPLCGRNFEYYSEDPRLAGQMAAALIRGVQQAPGYYVTVKHFACNNQEDHRTSVSSNVSERALREIYLKAFEPAVRDAKAKAVMTSYNKLNGIYTANSQDLCTRVLRSEWGFDGVVMTDWGSTNEGCASSALAIHVGNDLIMPGSKQDKKAILSGLKAGICTRQDLRRCCGNVLHSIFSCAIQREYIDRASR